MLNKWVVPRNAYLIHRVNFRFLDGIIKRTAVDFFDEFEARGRVFCLYIFHLLVNVLATVPSLYQRRCLSSEDGIIRTNTKIGSSLSSLINGPVPSMTAYIFHSDSLRLMFSPQT
jgi:hypothetical protein